MKRILTALLLTTLTASALAQISSEANPQADPQAVVTSGRARFTVLTDRMIRIQYSASGKFEDRATFAVINRLLPLASYTQREEGDYLYIETSALTLRYKKGSTISASLRSPNNLSITMRLNGREVIWYPGKDDALNLPAVTTSALIWRMASSRVPDGRSSMSRQRRNVATVR